MFTDIEGSVGKWEAAGSGFVATLAEHNRIVRDCVREHRGIQVRFTGDGWLAAFPDERWAVRCALALERWLAAGEWPEGSPPIRLRIALHAGEVEFLEGDYVGTSVNILSRILEATSGGQVLASATVAETAGAALEGEAAFADLGTRRLRGVTAAQHLFLVVPEGAGLPSYVPLRDLDSLPTNLPAQLDEFVGREAESAEIARLLRGPTCRLLTITGTGGVGKTRLAQEVALTLLDAFRDGVWLVDLTAVAACRDIPAAIAASLRLLVAEVPEDPVHGLALALQPKALLLVLDNYEHLMEAADIPGRLLAEAPNVRCIITSRERLLVRGEHVVDLNPMAMPDPAGPRDAQRLTESMRLFEARLAQVRGRPLDEREIDEAADSCRTLGGLPLAIELAAAALSRMTTRELAASLRSALDVPARRSRDLPPRQASLRGAIAWSIALLSESESRALTSMAVFEGGFFAEAAEAVCRCPDARDLLERLRDKSLLTTETRLGRTRYGMLPPVRDYCRELLGDRWAECRDLAMEHFARVTHGLDLTGSGQGHNLAAANTDLPEIRRALEWALHRGRDDIVRDIVWAVWPVFWMAGQPGEGRRWMAESAEACLRLGDEEAMASIVTRAAATHRWGRALDRAQEALERARPIVERRGPGRLADLWRLERAALAWARGSAEEAEGLLGECMEAYMAWGNQWGIVQVLKSLAEIRAGTGDHEGAVRLLEDAVSREDAETQPWGVSNSLLELGRVQLGMGEVERAVSSLWRSAELCRRFDDKAGLVGCLSLLADALQAAGRAEAAGLARDEAVAIARRHAPYLVPEV